MVRIGSDEGISYNPAGWPTDASERRKEIFCGTCGAQFYAPGSASISERVWRYKRGYREGIEHQDSVGHRVYAGYSLLWKGEPL